MKIIWTEFATFVLKEIYAYYKEKVSVQVAQNIKTEIFITVRLLAKHPKLGTVEQNLSHLTKEYRFVVSGNYKIIYHLDEKIIYINDVFDCRQDPQKIKERIK